MGRLWTNRNVIRHDAAESSAGTFVDIAANGRDLPVGALQNVHKRKKHQVQIGINGIVHQFAWHADQIIDVKAADIDHNASAAAPALRCGDNRINPPDVLPFPQQRAGKRQRVDRIFLCAVASEFRKFRNISVRFVHIWKAVDVHNGHTEVGNDIGRRRVVDHQGNVELSWRMRLEFVVGAQEVFGFRDGTFIAMENDTGARQLFQYEAKLAHAAPADMTCRCKQREF